MYSLLLGSLDTERDIPVTKYKNVGKHNAEVIKRKEEGQIAVEIFKGKNILSLVHKHEYIFVNVKEILASIPLRSRFVNVKEASMRLRIRFVNVKEFLASMPLRSRF
ncbi:hypothetical protein Pcinc_035910 [Petrolisthes cinctipes]|uniref:Uncharacterized protein n=1 Tax=Petrolisthes cinctipes TaxID=88211 RepID=A0AAE1EN46_PETCI|nr:hypothetical protein Pcinc_035910 [Petrolisthes cinctipes]